ncbi:hypothetical protein ABIB62_003005 [Mucilaginibacter sp. UYP25]|uniref:hypothetical protein n=1 Tax=unclassified Mucilaginibacter TaxID=2617802 RepID=UPI003390945E
MYKPIVNKPLNIGDRFNVAFPDGIPLNSNVDKSKTALGITYAEMMAPRNSILALSSVPIIEDKYNSKDYAHIQPFKIIKGVTSGMIANELLREDGYKYKKLLVTPESFPKIIEAAKSIRKLKWLYNDFFLFLDESHCYAVEAFREDILNPFKFIEHFKNVSMGSATPFPYSHPRFNRLENYKITYKEKFGVVTLINNEHPQSVMMHFIKNPDMFPGRVHVFFASVTATAKLINTSGITEVMVACNCDKKNMVNLGEAIKYYVEQPSEKDFKKFNFYTSRYNEGWDLIDDSTATMIFLTDKAIPHTLGGIQFKGFQCVGRLRSKPDNKPNKIYHITNNLELGDMKSIEEIQKIRLYNANAHIRQFNEHKIACKNDGQVDLELLLPVIKNYTDLNNGKAYLNLDKLDQQSCAQYCRETYNNAETIKSAWEKCNYDVEEIKFSIPVIVHERKSSATINKEIVDHIKELRINPSAYIFDNAANLLKHYRQDYNILIDAIELLGIEKIEQLKYSNNDMKAQLIEQSNKNVDAQLRLLIGNTFDLNGEYTNKEIKVKLQGLYDQLNIRKPDGSRKIAKASDLNNFNMFELDEGKVKDEKGKWQHGLKVLRINYTIANAA